MELSQLEHFKAVAEFNSLSKAAEKLYITQSALSKSIAKLEKELGIPLFAHSKNKLILNDNGKTVLDHVTKLFNELRCINQFVEWKKEENSINIAFSDYHSKFHIARIMLALIYKINIGSDIMRTDEVYSALLNQTIHAAITRIRLDHPEIESYPLYEEELLVIVPASHRLYTYNSDTLPFKELDGETFLVYGNETPSKDTLHKALSERNIKLKINQNYNWHSYSTERLTTHFLTFSSTIGRQYSKTRNYTKAFAFSERLQDITCCTHYFSFRKQQEKTSQLCDLYELIKEALMPR